MSFSVFLSSINGTADAVQGNANVLYNVDWNLTSQHKGRFEVSFMFVSGGIAATPDNIFLPIIEWQAAPNVFSTFNPSTVGGGVIQSYGAFTSSALGFIKASTMGVAPSGQFSCDINSNVPIIISKRPMQNQFSVRLVNVDGTLFAMGVVPYVLGIYFKALYE